MENFFFSDVFFVNNFYGVFSIFPLHFVQYLISFFLFSCSFLMRFEGHFLYIVIQSRLLVIFSLFFIFFCIFFYVACRFLVLILHNSHVFHFQYFFLPPLYENMWIRKTEASLTRDTSRIFFRSHIFALLLLVTCCNYL